MAARFSASGKRIGRPPKAATPQPPSADAQALAIGKAFLTAQNRYDAAGRGRRMAGWAPPSSGPNSALQGLQLIRDRSRDASRNDWAGESTAQKWTTHLIGIGITPRFRRIKSKTRKLAIADLWSDFVQQADADCVLNLYGLQTLAVRTWIDGGECFIRRRNRFSDEGLPVPMQIQLLEGDMVPLLDAEPGWDPRMGQGNIIRSGIELNKRGKRVAYWFYINHPGDQANSLASGNALVRVPASEVAHMYEPKRPGQMRGVSILAPVLARLRGIGDYEDTTLERQKIANLWVGFLSRTIPPVDINDPQYDPLTGGPATLDENNNALVPLKPGLIQELGDGETMNFANPPEAGTNYSDYMRTSHMGTAAAAGLPYELFAGDIREISDRTLRVLINDLRRFAEQRQWQIVIPQMCQKVIDWFAESAFLASLMSEDEIDDVKRCEHAPHGWAYIHPVQDVQGKAMEVSNGFRSRSSVIGERGDDPENVDEERASDQEREEELGLPIQGVLPTTATDDPTDQGDGDGIDNEEYSAPPNPTTNKLELALLARLEAQTDELRARQRRHDAPPPAPAVDPETARSNDLMARALDLLGPSGESE